MSAFASALVVAVVVWALTALVMRPGHLHLWVIFAGSLVGLPLLWWWTGTELTGFRLVKTVSVAAAGILIAALRAAESPGKLLWVLWGFFALNILQAVATEPLSGRWMNPLAGTLLLGAIALPRHASAVGGRLRWELGWPFVLAYSLWNFTFVYSSGPPGEVFGQWGMLALAHLGVPLLVARRDVGCWIEARAIALFFTILWLDHAPGPPWLVPSDWYNEAVAQVLQAASLLTALALLASAATGRLRVETPVGRLLGHRAA